MNEPRLRKIYKEKADKDWDEEGPYLSMSETEFVETVKELIKERDELIRECIQYVDYAIKYSTPLSQKGAEILIDKAKKMVGENEP